MLLHFYIIIKNINVISLLHHNSKTISLVRFICYIFITSLLKNSQFVRFIEKKYLLERDLSKYLTSEIFLIYKN